MIGAVSQDICVYVCVKVWVIRYRSLGDLHIRGRKRIQLYHNTMENLQLLSIVYRGC